MPVRSTLCCLAILGALHGISALRIISGTPSSFTGVHAPVKALVTLHDDGLPLPEGLIIPPGSTPLAMTDSRGRQYTCFAPPRPDAVSTEVDVTDHHKTAGVAWSGLKSPFELLERLNTICLYRQEGLWTYEMCYKKHARQFRQGSSEHKGEDFSCGQYSGDEAQSEEIQVDTASPPDLQLKYVSHIMTGGAPCVLSGQPRTTEVRFMCVSDVTDNVILSVREFPTCRYIYTVATPLLCSHPAFKPPADVVRTVRCIPDGTPVPSDAAPPPAPAGATHQQEHPQEVHTGEGEHGTAKEAQGQGNHVQEERLYADVAAADSEWDPDADQRYWETPEPEDPSREGQGNEYEQDHEYEQDNAGHGDEF